MTDIDRSIPFVDAYHHVTEPSLNPYDWLTEDGAIYSDYLGDYKLARADWPMDRLLRESPRIQRDQRRLSRRHVRPRPGGRDPLPREASRPSTACPMPTSCSVT